MALLLLLVLHTPISNDICFKEKQTNLSCQNSPSVSILIIVTTDTLIWLWPFFFAKAFINFWLLWWNITSYCVQSIEGLSVVVNCNCISKTGSYLYYTFNEWEWDSEFTWSKFHDCKKKIIRCQKVEIKFFVSEARFKCLTLPS